MTTYPVTCPRCGHCMIAMKFWPKDMSFKGVFCADCGYRDPKQEGKIIWMD
jgi:transcription elongation factor Elf1